MASAFPERRAAMYWKQPPHSWERWLPESSEDAAKFEKLEKMVQELHRKVEWLHKVVHRLMDTQEVNEESDQRLHTQVSSLVEDNKELKDKVTELESASARRGARPRSSSWSGPERDDADASEGNPQPESRRARRCVRPRSSSWSQPERVAAADASEGNPQRPGGAKATCKNCFGGMVLDHETEQALLEMWNEYPLELWSWASHLGSTLFSEKGTKHWAEVHKKLTYRTGHFLVWGSMHKNQRFFVVQCRDCHSLVKGSYSRHDSEEDAKNARDALSNFLIGKPAENSFKT